MVEAARKTNQIVQVDLQRHSSQYVREAVARVQVGEIGKVTVERCFPLTKKFPVGIGSHEDCDLPTVLG